MITLKKIWAFLKTHWYIPVIIIIGVVLKSQNNRMLKIIDIQKESYDKQKAAIEAAEIEKELKKQKIEKEYTEAVTTIEAIYEVHNKELEQKKKKEIKNIVKKYYNKPEEISSRIFKSFGLIYVPTKNNNNPD
jgi:Na+-transporting NADH:ubiquinone oxidoreductase subunit NqrC